jgi:hypothetical protein
MYFGRCFAHSGHTYGRKGIGLVIFGDYVGFVQSQDVALPVLLCRRFTLVGFTRRVLGTNITPEMTYMKKVEKMTQFISVLAI